LIWPQNRAFAFEPVLAVRAVVRSFNGDSLFKIWTVELVTSTVVTFGIMLCGKGTKLIVTVVPNDFLGHSVVPTSVLRSFSFEITHKMGQGMGFLKGREAI